VFVCVATAVFVCVATAAFVCVATAEFAYVRLLCCGCCRSGLLLLSLVVTAPTLGSVLIFLFAVQGDGVKKEMVSAYNNNNALSFFAAGVTLALHCSWLSSKIR
jgi:hypothetical protein